MSVHHSSYEDALLGQSHLQQTLDTTNGCCSVDVYSQTTFYRLGHGLMVLGSGGVFKKRLLDPGLFCFLFFLISSSSSRSSYPSGLRHEQLWLPYRFPIPVTQCSTRSSVASAASCPSSPGLEGLDCKLSPLCMVFPQMFVVIN